MTCRLCNRTAPDVREAVVYVRASPKARRWGFLAIVRCKDRGACRARWNDQAKGPWPLVEADLPAPHWLRETS